jgi:hypothetical protein
MFWLVLLIFKIEELKTHQKLYFVIEMQSKKVVSKLVASVSFNVTFENEGFCLNFDGIEQNENQTKLRL